MFAERLKTAFSICWIGLSALLLPVLAALFLLPREFAPAVVPAVGRECAVCGIAAGFLFIGQGRLNAAVQSSPWSIPIFSVLVWNECVALWYSLWQLRRALTPRSRVAARPEEVSCRS